MIGRTLGHYRIVGRVGAGGMGEVYRAFDDRLDREVAVKVLPAEYTNDADRLRRFDKEARATGRLNHPNLLAVYDVGFDSGIAYLVTELLEGETLRDRIARGALPCRKAVELSVQIVAGLAAAHDKSVVHRDLKPENLFVTGDGRVKILDFGLAKVTEDRSMAGDATLTEVAATQPGTVIGTMGYMAPEQVRGLDLDHRADIFAFGAILYEMLSGRRAFAGATRADVMTAVLLEDPAELGARGDVPPGLSSLLARCLEKEPGERFKSARDLGYALEAELLSLTGSPARGASLAERRSEAVSGGGLRSLAVLCLQDLAGDPENAHLGIGLTDAIITELARTKSLVVRPTAASLRLQDRRLDPQEAGRELAVDAVVDGKFQRSGSRLRVTAQLISTEEGRPIWGAKFDADADDIFGMQDDVSARVAAALRLELSEGDRERIARRRRPVPEAYELYLKGKLYLYRETAVDPHAAIGCFERARAEDRNFASAWAGLGSAYARLAYTFEPEAGWYERARRMCERALELDPDLAEGHLVRAYLVWSPEGGFDHAAALGELAATLAAAPGLAEALTHLGTVLFHLALFGESSRILERAIEIDPDYWDAHVMLATCRYLEGRYAEAAQILERRAEAAGSSWARYVSALCEFQSGDVETASRAAERELEAGSRSVYFHSLRALIAARQGRAEDALAHVDLTVHNQRAFGHYHHAQHDVAGVFSLLERPGEALRWLKSASANGFPCHAAFARDPLLAPLRQTEGFARLLDALRVECEGYARLYGELGFAR